MLRFVLPRFQNRDIHPVDQDLSMGTPDLGACFCAGSGTPQMVVMHLCSPTLHTDCAKDGVPS